MLQGKRIDVRDGVCVDENGVLSGSALDMASAVRNAVAMLGVPLEQAVRMASTYPAAFLGLGGELGRIAPGYRANLVAADDDLAIHETWIDGVTARDRGASNRQSDPSAASRRHDEGLEPLGRRDQARADAGLEGRMAGIGHHRVVGLGPGAVQVVGRDGRAHDVVASLHDHRRDRRAGARRCRAGSSGGRKMSWRK